MTTRARRLLTPLTILVPLAAAAVTWRPLLRAWFHADDFTHLYDLVTMDRVAFLTQVWAGHLLTVFNAVTLALYTAFGPDPVPAFRTVVATHLLNVLLAWVAARRLGAGPLGAGWSAFAWGTCPTLAGALGWYSVYGQVILTACILPIAADLAHLVRTGRTLRAGRALLWGLLLIAGGASFGSGLGLAVAIPVAVVLALPRAQRTRPALAILAIAALAILAAYAVAREHTADFAPRARELMSPETTLRWLPEAALMTAQLLGFGASALIVAPIVPGPPITGELMALAGAGVLALGIAGWRAADRRTRRLHLALWLLLLAVYATTAAGRAAVVEAMGTPVARAALWPRYQYLALALLTLTSTAALAALAARGAELRGAVRGAAGAWAAIRLFLLAVQPVAIDLHPESRAADLSARTAIRRAVAEAPPTDVVRLPNAPFGGVTLPTQFPGQAALFVIHFPDGMVDGRPVRFLVSSEDWERIQARGGRIARVVEPR